MVESPQATRPQNWSRIDGIDCLRALAIFFVLMNHVNMRLFLSGIPYLKDIPKQLGASLVWQGQAGVQVFFAVSGFLITATTLQRWKTPSSFKIREFYFLRFARIAPLLITLLAVLSILHALQLRDFAIAPELGGLKGALVAALTLRVGLLEATKGYLPANWDVLWSLSVEETFYLIFPLAWRLFGRGKRLVFFLAIFVVLGPFGRTILTHGNVTWQEYSYLGGMDAIALGCLTALLVTRRCFARPVLMAFLGTGLALLTFCIGFSFEMGRLGLEDVGLGMTLIAVGTCMLITVAVQTKWKAPRLLSPLLAYGRRSYEIYLLHMFFVFACFNSFMKHGQQLWLVPLLFIVVIVLSGVLGSLVGRYYSEPANSWLRKRLGGGCKRSISLLSEVQAS